MLRIARHIVPPPPAETFDATMTDGATIVLRRHGNPEGPRVALSHGNGMAIEAYYPFWQHMLDGYDVILFDSRNHGRNPADGVDNHTQAQFGQDFETVRTAIDEAFGPRPCAAVFHSLASIASLNQTRHFGERWSPLILIDPPIFPPSGHPLVPLQTTHMKEMDAIAARRPDRFDDPEDLAAVLRSRQAFRRWPEGLHELYALETLRQTADGWTLACPRALEAKIFATNIDPTIWPDVAGLPGDIAIIGADTGLPETGPPALLCQAIAKEHDLPYIMIEDTTHFLQFERGEAAWAAAEKYLKSFGAAC